MHTPQSRAAAGQFSTAVLLFAAALILTTLTRFLLLDERPLHTDEAVQAQLYLNPMLEGEGYTYRSADGHGPALVYSTRLLGALIGVETPEEVSVTLLRLTPALYSLGLIFTLLLMLDGLGRRALGWAALFTALSPSLAYYSRYYIMEVPLVFFTALAIGTGWRYAVSRHPWWLGLTGVAVGLMQVTKETFLIPLIAGVLAVVATNILEYFLAGTGIGQITKRRNPREGRLTLHLVIAVVVAGAVSFLGFSGFLKHPAQFFESLKSYVEYAERAEGAGHEKPWWYYLKLLIGRRDADGIIVGEWPLLALAAIGVGRAFFATPERYENKRLQRFLSFYTVALLIGYSLIAYKTPWLVLGVGQGVILLAGVGAATLLNAATTKLPRLLVWGVLLVSSGYLAVQIWRQNFVASADAERNPYVYSHTSPDILRLVRRVEEAAATAPDPKRFNVYILHPEFGWPLPWYFRKYGGGASDEMPEDSTLLTHADVIIASRDDASLLGALVSSTHREFKEDYLLRPDTPLRAIFRRDLLSDLPAADQGDQTEPAPPARPSLNPSTPEEATTPPDAATTPIPIPAPEGPASDPSSTPPPATLNLEAPAAAPELVPVPPPTAGQ